MRLCIPRPVPMQEVGKFNPPQCYAYKYYEYY